jgi:hypothetical protein
MITRLFGLSSGRRSCPPTQPGCFFAAVTRSRMVVLEPEMRAPARTPRARRRNGWRSRYKGHPVTTVLVADDEPDFCEVLVEYLVTRGFGVI